MLVTLLFEQQTRAEPVLAGEPAVAVPSPHPSSSIHPSWVSPPVEEKEPAGLDPRAVLVMR
jgi:hypothetical protein